MDTTSGGDDVSGRGMVRAKYFSTILTNTPYRWADIFNCFGDDTAYVTNVQLYTHMIDFLEEDLINAALFMNPAQNGIVYRFHMIIKMCACRPTSRQSSVAFMRFTRTTSIGECGRVAEIREHELEPNAIISR
jgi:hypothetical protein